MTLQKALITPEEASTIIEVRNLTKRFVTGSKTAAVDNVSFRVGREVVTLLGPSGCGKTTTLRCIAGLEKPDEGEIIIDGKVVTSVKDKIFIPPEKRNIGLVFQSYALWPHMKVFDNVAYGLKVKHFSKDEIRERVQKALEMVGMGLYADRYPSQLSGGQQQRVAFARSLIYEPKVLLLDEPLSNLDAKIREKTRFELKNLLQSTGIASVYVTHDQEEAFLLSDRIVVMNQGRVIQSDSPFNIYYYPADEFVASFVGRSNMIDGQVVSKSGSKGILRIFGNYDIRCSIPDSLPIGATCSLILRSNEIGMHAEMPARENIIPCEVVSREYKGAVTDHLVKVGNAQLIVTTHRFCELDRLHSLTSVQHNEVGSKVFLEIREEAVTVVPKRNASNPKREAIKLAS